MGRPTVALHISTRLFRDALSIALAPHADVVIVPDGPDEQQSWANAHEPVDLAIISGVDSTSLIDAPVVVRVAAAGGFPARRVSGSKAETVRTLEELVALLPEEDDGATTAT